MKISQRLQHINNMIGDDYQNIWDCCCDHGLLGLRLLERHAATTVHFVDIAAPLMLQLETKLRRFVKRSATGPQYRNWQVHCQDVATLKFSPACIHNHEHPHLIIIAGVGGECLIALLNAIMSRHPQQNLEFILCPVHHNYRVRQALIGWQLGLITEQLIRENNRFYEILHVSSNARAPISAVGSEMWDLQHKDHREYLRRTIAHYQRQRQNAKHLVQDIIEAYQELELS